MRQRAFQLLHGHVQPPGNEREIRPQVAATPTIHFGGVCEGGITCTGSRDLYDDFGIAVSPTTGLASITYSDDQPGNTGSDDHTAIATQTGGPRICSGR